MADGVTLPLTGTGDATAIAETVKVSSGPHANMDRQVVALGAADGSTADPLAALAKETGGNLAAAAASIAALVTANHTDLGALLAKLSADPATQTTLAAVLAKLSADPPTQTTLAAILAKLSADPSTNTTLIANGTLLSTLSGKDFATQATLAAVLAKLIAAPATEAKQDTGNTSLTTLAGAVSGSKVAVKSAAGDLADGAHATFGAKADAADTHTDATAISGMSVWKQISKSVQLMVFGAGTAAAAQRTTLASDDPAVATLGATSGAALAADGAGTLQQYLRSLLKLAFGTGIGTRQRYFSVAFTTLVRPANTTAYTANDSISDNATAGSVSALVAAVSDTNDAPVKLTELLVATTDTGLANGCALRAWLYNSDPTANSGVGAGDNAAFSNKQAGFIGTMSGIFRAFSDGGMARLVPDEGADIKTLPASGGVNLWVQYQALTGFTPSANSTTLIGRIKGEQGRA